MLYGFRPAPPLPQTGARCLTLRASSEPLAKLVGANGRSLWASWLMGLDPSDADVRDIALAIDVSGGVPCISWDPALPDRTYTLYGCDALAPYAPWYVVPTNKLETTSARFFRLSIGQHP